MNNSSPLKVIKGTEVAIADVRQEDGNLLFAYDTGKIYLDTNAWRYSMGAAGGATFLYTTEALQQQDDFYYLTYNLINAEKLKIDDIVVSGDNIICRVQKIDIDKNMVTVIPLASGGSGGLQQRRFSFVEVEAFPQNIIITADYEFCNTNCEIRCFS